MCIYIYSLVKLVYWKVCKFEFNLKKAGEGAAPPPKPKQIGRTYFHMQDAGLVYTTRHAPWKHVECRLRHNDAQ